jgi:hypothetical protein
VVVIYCWYADWDKISICSELWLGNNIIGWETIHFEVRLAFLEGQRVRNECKIPYMAIFCQILPSTFTCSAICHGNCRLGKFLWQTGKLLPTTLFTCSGTMRQSPTPHPSGPLSLHCSNFLETDYVSFQKYELIVADDEHGYLFIQSKILALFGFLLFSSVKCRMSNLVYDSQDLFATMNIHWTWFQKQKCGIQVIKGIIVVCIFTGRMKHIVQGDISN